MTQNSPDVRVARPSDARGIVEAHYSVVHEQGGDVYDQEILDKWSPGVSEERIRVMKRQIRDRSAVYFVAEINEDVVGFSVIVPDEAQIRAVYVHSDYTGQGAGTLLLEALEREARGLNLPYLQLHASLNAVEFYRSHGYSTLYSGYFDFEGTQMRCEIMRKVFSDEFVDPVPTLETDRLQLRPLQRSDQDSLIRVAETSSFRAQTFWNQLESKELIQSFMTEQVFHNYFHGVPDPLGMTRKDDASDLIGAIGCRWVKPNWKTMELRFAIRDGYRSVERCLETTQALLDFVFQRFDVHRVQSSCMNSEEQKRSVLEELDLEQEGTREEAIHWEGDVRDICDYAILERDWEGTALKTSRPEDSD